MALKRDLMNRLVKWKAQRDRKPLILHGARQVGKTTLLKTFGKVHYDHTFYLNFEDTPKLKSLFEDDLNPANIIKKLSIYFKQSITTDNTLFIFDEIQECSNALNSLKYFNENAPQYHVAAAGSLLGVKLGNKKGFPVGQVQFFHLYPLSFMEFLDANDESSLRNHLNEIKQPEPLSLLFHDKLIELLKTYFFTGGMPEAVCKYTETDDFQIVRTIQKDIIKSYHQDFSKHATAALSTKISKIWDTLPNQLGKENKKFMYSVIRDSARAREYEEALDWLDSAGLINKLYNITTPRIPLTAYAELDVFKVYPLDVGILNAMADLQPIVLLEGNALFQEFRGSLTESYAAQTMAKYTDKQFYWSSAGKAEVDIIFQTNNHIYPLEIKSGTTTKQKSLNIYDQKFHPKRLLRTSMLNLKLDNRLLNIPLYLLDNIENFF